MINKCILLLTLSLTMFLITPGPVLSDTMIKLDNGEMAIIECAATEPGACPEPEIDIAYAHGGDHKRMTKEAQDCRTCHGADLQGTSKSIAEFARTCIAPDKFQMPDNVMETERYITTWPDGEVVDIVGTKTARVEVGDVVGCQICHDEVKFENAEGEKIEMKVRDD